MTEQQPEQQAEQPEQSEAQAEQAEQPEQTSQQPEPQPEPQAEQPEQPAQQAEQAEQQPEQPTPSPVPRPGPRPAPRPAPHPSPAVPAPDAPAVHVPPASDPRPWGRVADDGTVYVVGPEGERPVGSYPGATPEEALAYFGRKYDELAGQVALLEQRLASTEVAPQEAARTVAHLREQVRDAHAVGDLAGLESRLEAVAGIASSRRKEADRARAAARTQAAADRTRLVEEAEGIAGTDPERMQWKPSGDRLRRLFEEWKEAQRHGPRLDRPTEDALWKRFSHARTAFDRARRQHFSHLEERNAEVRAVKERLVAEAESLAGSTDWGPTTSAYRQLMDRWKAAGRGGRKDDDALWARFRAAQDRFFAARTAANAAQDQELGEGLVVKEKLLAEAEALLPVTDVRAAKAALRDIQERWEAAGKVPRADLGRVEKRMRAVEEAVRGADEARWRRSNPEQRARAEGAVAQLEAAIAGLERELTAARQAGDEAAAQRAEQALEARRSWLELSRRAADDLRG